MIIVGDFEERKLTKEEFQRFMNEFQQLHPDLAAFLNVIEQHFRAYVVKRLNEELHQ
jgi:hypothetical protein